MFRAYPKVEIGGTTYDSLVEPPTGLKVVAGLPLLLLILAIGALPILFAFGAVYFNMGVLRSGRRGTPAVAQMLAITVAAGAILVVILSALTSASSTS